MKSGVTSGTEVVALVDDAPQIVRAGLHRQARAVAQSGGVVANALSLRIEHAHHGAILFFAPGGAAAVGLFMLPDLLGRHGGHASHPQIGRRADGEEQALAIPGDREIARPVPLRRNVADDHFGRTRRLGVSAAIRISDHLVRRRDIDVFGIVGRLEDDAVGPVQFLGEDLGLRRRAAASARNTSTRPAAALRQEDVAVRRDAKGARLLESGGEHLHREAVRYFGQRALRRLDHLRVAGDRLFRIRARRRRWQVRRLDVAANAGGVASQLLKAAAPVRGSEVCACNGDARQGSANSANIHRRTEASLAEHP